MWLKKWSIELASLVLIGILVTMLHGLKTGLHVSAMLVMIAMGVDVVRDFLCISFRKCKANTKVLFINILVVCLYCYFLIVNQLNEIVYLTIFPSLMLGGLFYFAEAKQR